MRTIESSPPLAITTSQPPLPPKAISLKGSSIKGNSRVYGSAQVERCRLSESVEVSGYAEVKHTAVSGNVRIGERAVIAHCTIADNAIVMGSVTIKHCTVKNNAVATDNVTLKHMNLIGNARARGDAQIKHGTIDDDSVVEGHSVVKHSNIKGKSLITGDSEVNGCNIIDSVICHGAKVSGSNFKNHWLCGKGQIAPPVEGKFSGRDDPRVNEHLGLVESVSPFYSEPAHSLPPPTPTKDRIPPSPISPPSVRPAPAYADPKAAPPAYDEVTSPDSTARRLGSLRIDQSRVDEKVGGFGYDDPPEKR